MQKLTGFFFIILISFSVNAQNFEWAKAMGSTNDDYVSDIAVDASGNVFTTGNFKNTADFDPGPGIFNLTSAGGLDIFISKLDASGNFVWAKQFGNATSEEGFSIAVDDSGNVYTTGYFVGILDFDPGPGIFNLTSNGGLDIFVLKLNSSGNFVWAINMGGLVADEANSIAVDAQGNSYITGYFFDSADFDPGPGVFNLSSSGAKDIFISKVDMNGNFVWAKALGGINTNEQGGTVTVDVAGNVYTVGTFQGVADFDPGAATFNILSNGGSDTFISKLDSTGNFIWAKAIGGTDHDQGHSLVADTSGNVYITGSFRNTVDFDPGAGIFNLTSTGLDDIFISKLNASGSFVWAEQIGGTNNDRSYSIAMDASGYLYATGDFRETVDFDPGTGNSIMTSAGGSDIFILSIDSTGNFIWIKTMGEPNLDNGIAITLDAAGNIYTTGWFAGTIDFDPGSGIYNLTSAGNIDIFVHKMSMLTGMEELNAAAISIYPNPVNDILNINSLREIGGIKIYDVVGKLIYHELIKNNNSEVNLKELNAGIYFIEINNSRTKIVKE